MDESGIGSDTDTSGTLGSQLECSRVFFDSLVKYKPHLNTQDINGNTALHIACQYFHLGAVDAARYRVRNFKSQTYMKIAFALLDGKLEVDFVSDRHSNLGFLSKAGADPTIKNRLGLSPLDYAPHLMDLNTPYIRDWIVHSEATGSEAKTISKAEPDVRSRAEKLFNYQHWNETKSDDDE